MKYRRLQHRFVQYIPKELQPGVLYISIEFATAAHSCCCGCGEEVVTPFTPHDWHMTFDGETVSLWPSIGNWDYPCQSHYIVRRNRVIEARPWTDDEIAAGRRKDKAAKAEFYELHVGPNEGQSSVAAMADLKSNPLFSRIKNWFGRRK
jgi:Family of unknown function (DUF6527)